MDTAVAPVSAVGRLLIALIFIRAGINKLGAIAATSAAMKSHGIPYPNILVWGAVLVELGGGLMLMAGFLCALGSTGAVLLYSGACAHFPRLLGRARSDGPD